MRTDAELIREYVAARSETAFAELAARHGPMVYRVCLAILGDPHDAEDAAQATFLVLVRKASGLGRAGGLAAWLQEVARRVCRETLRSGARRAEREEEAAMLQAARGSSEGQPPMGRKVPLAAVQEELGALSRVEREAVVLRYLEGRSQEEAAKVAGVPRGTLARRASDGLERLRVRLSRRGIGLSALALGALFASQAEAAVPGTLLPSILAVPRLAAAGAAAGAAGGLAVSLAEGAMKAMFWAKVKMAAAVAVAAAMLGTAVPLTVAAVSGSEPAATATDKVIECRVTEILSDGRVKLSAGSAQGVREKFEFDVSRDGKPVGAVRAVSVAEKETVAEVIGAEAPEAAGDVSWGQAVNGLQAGLSLKQTKFDVGKTMKFDVRLKNVGATELLLAEPNDSLRGKYKVIFLPRNDKELPRVARYTGPLPPDRALRLQLLPGREERYSFEVAGDSQTGWAFEDARSLLYDLGVWKGEKSLYRLASPVKALPVGAYTMRIFYSNADNPVGKTWVGTVSTGPVEIEIVEPGSAKIPAPPAPSAIRVGDLARTRFAGVGARTGRPDIAPPGAATATSKLAEGKFRDDLLSRGEALSGNISMFLDEEERKDARKAAAIKRSQRPVAIAQNQAALERAAAGEPMPGTKVREDRRSFLFMVGDRQPDNETKLRPRRRVEDSFAFGPAVRNLDLEIEFCAINEIPKERRAGFAILLVDADRPNLAESLDSGEPEGDFGIRFEHGRNAVQLMVGDKVLPGPTAHFCNLKLNPDAEVALHFRHDTYTDIRLVTWGDQGEILLNNERVFSGPLGRKGVRWVPAIKTYGGPCMGIIKLKADELLEKPPENPRPRVRGALTAGFGLRLTIKDRDDRPLSGVALQYADMLVTQHGRSGENYRPLPASAADGTLDARIAALTASAGGDARRVLRFRPPPEMAELVPDPAEIEVDPRKEAAVEMTVTLRPSTAGPAGTAGTVTGFVSDGQNPVAGKVTVKLLPFKEYERSANVPLFRDCPAVILNHAFKAMKTGVDRDGRFTFEKVPPGEYVIGLSLDYADMMELPAPGNGKLPPGATHFSSDKGKTKKILDTLTNRQGLTVPAPLPITVRGGDKVGIDLRMSKKGAPPVDPGQKTPPEVF